MTGLPDKGYLNVVRLLIDKGADVNAKDKEGETPLMFGASGQNGESSSSRGQRRRGHPTYGDSGRPSDDGQIYSWKKGSRKCRK